MKFEYEATGDQERRTDHIIQELGGDLIRATFNEHDLLVQREAAEVSVSGKLMESLQNTSELFAYIDEPVPTVQDLMEHGLDIRKLTQHFEAMQAGGDDPQIILAPAFELSEWERLFQSVYYNNPAVTSYIDILHNLGANPQIAAPFVDSWKNLPTNTVKLRPETEYHRGHQWSLRLVPSLSDHNLSEGHFDSINIRDHLSIAEYLTIHAFGLITGGEPPRSRIWLNTAFVQNLAVYGEWHPDAQTIFISDTARDVSLLVVPSVSDLRKPS